MFDPITRLTAALLARWTPLVVGALLFALGCEVAENLTSPFATLGVTTASIPDGVENVEYSKQTLLAAGGDGSYSWALVSSSPPLPTGLALAANGEITGTPSAAGIGAFVVQVASGDGQSATKTLTITVRSQPVLQASDLCSDNPGYAIASFEDANLEATIRAALFISAQDNLTCALVSGLMTLDAHSAGITSLMGLQNLTSLTDLLLDGNSITDVSALTALTSLTTVLLQDNSNLITVQPLIENTGFGSGDLVNLGSTSVSCADVVKLMIHGVTVISDCVSMIAFRRGNRVDSSEIYVMDADGSNAVNLTNNATDDYQPAWSPDGSKIAFGSYRNGNSEIYVMDADGSNAVNLTNNAARDDQPAWSPDGSKIAFGSDRNGNREIHVMNADGSDHFNLTTTPTISEFRPAWSPDGSKIAFRARSFGTNSAIYVMDADGSNRVRLTNNPGDSGPAFWSPDGSRIAFISGRDGNSEIFVMNADGSGRPVNLTNSEVSEDSPAWSPDGSRIVFKRTCTSSLNCPTSPSGLYVMDADGSNVVRFTNDAEDHWPTWALVR